MPHDTQKPHSAQKQRHSDDASDGSQRKGGEIHRHRTQKILKSMKKCNYNHKKYAKNI